MDYEEAERFIRRLEGGNEEDSYRANTNLSIVLRLALHSGLKPAYTYRLTVADLKETEDGGAKGYYIATRGGVIKHYFYVEPEDYAIIRKHCKKHRLSEGDRIITCTERACRMVFANVARVYYPVGETPQLKDVLLASPKRKKKIR